jgi:hypothetical protein
MPPGTSAGNDERRLGAILPIRNFGREQGNCAVFVDNRGMLHLTSWTAVMMAATAVIILMKRDSRGSL